MPLLFRIGRTFTYSLTMFGYPRPQRRKYTLVEATAAEGAAYAMSFLDGRGRWPFTPQRLRRATHFYNTGKGGNVEDDTAFLVFPLDAFAELVSDGRVPWKVGWGEGETTVLEKVAAKPLRIRVDGKPQLLPVIGARAGNCTLAVLDDHDFPLVLAHDEAPYPMRLLYAR